MFRARGAGNDILVDVVQMVSFSIAKNMRWIFDGRSKTKLLSDRSSLGGGKVPEPSNQINPPFFLSYIKSINLILTSFAMTVTSGLRVWAATCLLLLSSQHFPIGLATADPSDNLLRQRDLQSCFNHIEDINTLEDSIEDTMVSRTYVLCPFTTYGLGSIDDDGSVVGGEEPLRLRSNAKVQCGESGESINGCLVYGGDYGILMLTPLLEDLSNVEIQGLTFSLQQKAAIVLGRPGDVTVTDCVIKVRQETMFVPRTIAGMNTRLTHFCFWIPSFQYFHDRTKTMMGRCKLCTQSEEGVD